MSLYEKKLSTVIIIDAKKGTVKKKCSIDIKMLIVLIGSSMVYISWCCIRMGSVIKTFMKFRLQGSVKVDNFRF